MRRAGPRLNRVRIVKGALRRLLDDECLDRAAGLSFYALLSAAPAILAMVSLLGVVGEAESTTKAVLSLVHGVSAEAAKAIRPIIVELTESSSAGVTLIGSLLLAIWSSSKYIGALGRALNAVYRVEETRPYWKFKPLMLLMTVVTLIVLAALGLLLVLSGPIAETLGELIGMGAVALLIWNVVRWPVFVFFVMLLIALLYYVTPNVRQPKFRWVSLGAFVALLDAACRVGLLRALHQQFQQLQRHLWVDRGSDRRARLGVDGQPLAAPRRRVRRRDRTRAATAVRR